MAVFIGDYFARGSKRSGAWMSAYRGQSKLGEEVRPIITNTMNFAKGAEGEATLLTFDDARTLFHEFGHGLHGMLSDVTYPYISCTSVARDFVELPSQLYEHWLGEKEVLAKYARHYKTGEPMPEALIDRVLAAENFGQGFGSVEYTASALVDLAMHELEDTSDFDPMAFEEGDAGRHRHAKRDRHAPPNPALRACLLRRRVFGGLLQLHVVRSDGRRRLRRLHRCG